MVSAQSEVTVFKVSSSVFIAIAGLLAFAPADAAAQQNVPPAVQQAERNIESAVRRFGIGIQGGVALDPELLDVGVHAAFGPIFTPAVAFRPGVELALGEVTTMLGINLDVLYVLPGTTADSRWRPYVGAGPNFSYSRVDFEPDDVDDDDNRFDFSDSDGNAGFNFIAGARNANGLFIELKATAYGVSTIRLLAGFDF
jgi:hypothetical protein